MDRFPDDYFKDVTEQITETDRVNAGYKTPGMNTSIPSIPKPISLEELRKDLRYTAIPVPINFAEGGMFRPMTRSSSHSPSPSRFSGQEHLKDDLQDHLKDPPSVSQDLTIVRSFSPEHHCEVIPISTDPYVNLPIIPQPDQHREITIGESRVVLARGPDNGHGQPGFMGGIFEPHRFGSYPSVPELYHPLDVGIQLSLEDKPKPETSTSTTTQVSVDQAKMDQAKMDQAKVDQVSLPTSPYPLPMPSPVGEKLSPILMNKPKSESRSSDTSPVFPTDQLLELMTQSHQVLEAQRTEKEEILRELRNLREEVVGLRAQLTTNHWCQIL